MLATPKLSSIYRRIYIATVMTVKLTTTLSATKNQISTYTKNLLLTTSLAISSLLAMSQDRVLGVDLSYYNNPTDAKAFTERNLHQWKQFHEDPLHHTPWVQFVYVRTSFWNKIDTSAVQHAQLIKEYNMNDAIPQSEKIALWVYHYFSHSRLDPESQVELFVQQYQQINQDNDGTLDLIPMLDVEHFDNTDIAKVRQNTLTRLQGVEERIWIRPWIYTWAKHFYSFFYLDERFREYPIWLWAYSPQRVVSHENDLELWIGHFKDSISFIPTIHQFSDKWIVPGLCTNYGKWTVDLNYTSSLHDILQQNNDYAVLFFTTWETHEELLTELDDSWEEVDDSLTEQKYISLAVEEWNWSLSDIPLEEIYEKKSIHALRDTDWPE